MDSTLHILHLEDDPADAELVQARIEEAGLACRITHVQTRDEFDEALRQDGYDIILADYRLPMYDGMSALRLAIELRPDVPFIFVSGTMGEEAVIEGLTNGATDYVLKQKLLRLAPAVKRALHEAENSRERKRAEKELRKLSRAIEQSASTIIITDAQGYIEYANPRFTETSGYSLAEALGQHTRILKSGHTSREEYQRLWETITEGKEWRGEFQNKKKNNELYWESASISPIKKPDGVITHFVAVKEDITERKRAERALEESEAKTRSILDNIRIGVYLLSPKMEILEMNHQMREWYPSVDSVQRPICYRVFNDSPRDMVCDFCPTCKTLQDGLVHEATKQVLRAGAVHDSRIVSSPVLNASGEVTAAITMIEDITERLSLESQFRQAQKMESVGRLAGGVAHDFNNMLGAVIGYTELAMYQVNPDHPLFAYLTEIRKAAERSANLTRQLLAFARKQTITPKVLYLNETIESMLKMLRRLIGEDIDLAWLPGKNLWPVKMDPSQIDQILANLCVNARDAIAGVGKIIIETHAVTFDEAYCAYHSDVVPGEYLLLAMSDDGCGMDKETLGKLFDPFFTTKEMGKGTGLGLATVYGIVKQNNGFINVYSEPGHGTIFKIYLPRHAAQTGQMREESPAAPVAMGYETILLVEDDPVMLEIVRLMLETLGYRALASSTPVEAIRVAREHAGKIHLLITDVVMPGMNGRDLAKNIVSLCPDIRRLFMSGYTSNVIAHQGVLDEGVNFIQKPFSIQVLATKVREALDSK
jgi:two-component system, cell cycle sensor histidine kinase and response regulator CckA